MPWAVSGLFLVGARATARIRRSGALTLWRGANFGVALRLKVVLARIVAALVRVVSVRGRVVEVLVRRVAVLVRVVAAPVWVVAALESTD